MITGHMISYYKIRRGVGRKFQISISSTYYTNRKEERGDRLLYLLAYQQQYYLFVCVFLSITITHPPNSCCNEYFLSSPSLYRLLVCTECCVHNSKSVRFHTPYLVVEYQQKSNSTNTMQRERKRERVEKEKEKQLHCYDGCSLHYMYPIITLVDPPHSCCLQASQDKHTLLLLLYFGQMGGGRGGMYGIDLSCCHYDARSTLSNSLSYQLLVVLVQCLLRILSLSNQENKSTTRA